MLEKATTNRSAWDNSMTLNKSLASNFAVINIIRVLIAILVALAVGYNTKEIVDANADLDRTHVALQRTLSIKGLITTLEFSALAAFSTGDMDLLSALNRLQAEFETETKLLQQVLIGQPEQLARAEDLRSLVSNWVVILTKARRTSQIVSAKEEGEPQEKYTSLSEQSTNDLLNTAKTKLTTIEAKERQRLVDQRVLVESVSERARLVVIFGCLIIVATGTVFYLLTTLGLARRIKRLVGATRQLAEGNIDVIVDNRSTDEIGELSTALNQMALRLRHVEEVAEATSASDFSKQVQVLGEQDRLAAAINEMSSSLHRLAGDRKADDWLKSGQAELHYKMRQEHDLIPLIQVVIGYLARYLQAQVGVLYLAEGKRFKLVGSYAYNKRNNNDNEFELGEGLIGQAALEQQSILFSQIPEGQNNLIVNSGLGEALPGHVMVLPLVHEGTVEAVLALGTNKKYTELELDFLEKIAPSVAISIHVTRTQQQLARLLEESKLQSEELQTQQEELRAANEELEEQAAMLMKSEEALRTKSDELQQLNAELEERTEELERRTMETTEKNRVIEQAKQAVEIQAQNLALASQYKSEFLANMSHELRTPLNSLLILSQSLANNRSGNLTDEQQEDARIIYQGGKALLGLINDILDLSKVEAGKLEIRFEKISIDTLLDNLRSQFSPIAKEKGLELVFEKIGDLSTPLYCDPQRLEQVLRNFLSNGLKFTHKGTVALKVLLPPSPVCCNLPALQECPVIAFAVSDTGIGISSDKQQRVFEAFQQADGSTSRTYGGTGLGLTISRELVKLLGGEIQLHSKAGQGSTFTLYLPLNVEPAVYSVLPIVAPHNNLAESRSDRIVAASLPAMHSSAPTRGEPDKAPIPRLHLATEAGAVVDDREVLCVGEKSVLVIEDDPAFARILVDLSRGKGYRGLIALRGGEGLELAEKYQPSAIILDLGLPDISGRQVLEQLKRNIKTRHIPVHVLSAEDKSNEVMQMGAVGFLTKPVSGEDVDALLTKLESLLQDKIKRVLLIEDDGHNRLAVTRLIANKDVEICAVGTGLEAHEKLLTEAYDCVILDLSLPDISGFELLNRLTQDEHVSLPPVVVYTGRELTSDEYKELSEYTSSIVIKGASSPERLLDETTLFLHSVESSLPNEQRNIIQMLHSPEQLLKGRKVLLVDDDLRNTYALSKVLREHGLVVSMADNGELALQKLEQEQGIELVLMDIMMPVMDGYEAMRKIRQQAKFNKLPMIALTAKAMPEDRAKSIEAGANDYCTKPVDVDRLMSMMRVWLFK